MPLPFASALVALLLAGMGIAAFARPAALLAPLGLAAGTADARNEIQAVYGGFGLAMAAMLVAPLWLPELGRGPALMVAAALAGMAGGRIVATLREGGIGRLPALFLGLEAAGAALLLL
ncbi:DUF4345 family protein [Zavarzinia compransoris]|nr:DUF4345 family protein [Zavarzinia compransoris]TDP47860.1 uncharacterized protein DUF4345 [Zavarzinia compransoris]